MKKKKSKKKRVNLGAKVQLVIIPVVVAVLLLVMGGLYKGTSLLIEKDSTEIITATTEGVCKEVEGWLNSVTTMVDAGAAPLEVMEMSPEEQKTYIETTAGQNNAFPAGIYIADTKGNMTHATFVPGEDFGVFEKAWYKTGIKSDKVRIGEVFFDEESRKNVVGVSGQLKDVNGNVRGVVAADVYLDEVNTFVEDVKLKQTGGCMLIDNSTSTILGGKGGQGVGQTLKELAQQGKGDFYRYVDGLISEKKEGTFEYNSKDEPLFVQVKKVEGADWALVSYVREEEVMNELNRMGGMIGGGALVSVIVLCLLIGLVMERLIVKPIKEMDGVAERIAGGSLDEKITYRSSDELGRLADNFNLTVQSLRQYTVYIDEISRILTNIADGKLNYTLENDYTGEFAKIRNALLEISDTLVSTINEIEDASEKVTSSAEQASETGLHMSQSATEQASSVEELAASISEVSERVKSNADSAKEASEESMKTEKDIEQSNRKMQEMMEAMNDISRKSDEIGKIVKTIEDIAFQTNILALNAAVEAARAGEAGKGFAVVADEVRNLASKSADAAKNTTVLIEETVSAVENGTAIAEVAAESMNGIVESSKRVAEIIDLIAISSEEQSGAITEITSGIEQVSQAIQMNAATAEESSAASEELTGQAKKLNELVEKFEV